MRYIIQLRPALFLLLCAAAASAQDAGIEGKWIGGGIVAPSQYSGLNEARASEFLGHEVQINSETIRLPDQTVCALGVPVSEQWHNDMSTFGSFGGDWAEIGLEQSESGFEVTTLKVDCADKKERLERIVSQPGSTTLLLDFGRVFLVLQ